MSEAIPHGTMDVDAFEAWLAAAAPSGRYELASGHVVAMAAERMTHNRIKGAVFAALRDGARTLPCEAIADGMAVLIDDMTLREPDAALRCGPALPGDATRYDDPVIVVEVTSPSTAQTDEATKLVEYARLPSVAHYLIFDTARGVVIHHRRNDEGFATSILTGGTIRLDPPGLTLDFDAILRTA